MLDICFACAAQAMSGVDVTTTHRHQPVVKENTPMPARSSLASRVRRLGLGIAAAALAVTALVAPFTAAAQEQESEIETVSMSAATRFVEASVLGIVPTDIEVIPQGKTKTGRTVTYKFLIKNNGPADAAVVHASKHARSIPLIGSGEQAHDVAYWTFSLANNASVPVTVTCMAAPGYTCDRGELLVYMNDATDLNWQNNDAVIH